MVFNVSALLDWTRGILFSSVFFAIKDTTTQPDKSFISEGTLILNNIGNNVDVPSGTIASISFAEFSPLKLTYSSLK